MTERIQIGSSFAGYRVDSVLGRGGMGVVFRAEQPRLGRMVAIKVIAPELASDDTFRERFSREARLAAAIEHPNAIPIYEAGVENGTPYLVMRFVDGVDLSSVIKHDGRISAERAVAVIEQVAGALDEAHHRGLVHRDVKPANVLVEDRRGNEHAYLTDFGLTKQTDSLTGVTATGRWVGTIDYASPEQIRGQRVDARADVYSLGCLLFASLTGRVPFERDADVAKLYAHINDPPPLVGSFDPNLPRELDWVVNRALAKDPDERFQSAGDFGRAAYAAVHGEPVSKAERTVATGAAAPDESISSGDVAAPTPPSGPVVPPTDAAASPAAEQGAPTEPGAPSRLASSGSASAVPPTGDSQSPMPSASGATVALPGGSSAGGPTPSRLDASPGEAPTRIPKAPPKEKRSKIGILLALAVVAVAAIIFVATRTADPGGSDSTAQSAQKPSPSAPKTLDQPDFTVQVPSQFGVKGVGDLSSDQGTSVGSELKANGIDIQVVREKKPTEPATLVATADSNNQTKADKNQQAYNLVSMEPTDKVDSEGSSAVRYEYQVGKPAQALSTVVTYAFVRGGVTWRTRVQLAGTTPNLAQRADEISLDMARTLKPKPS